MVRRVELASLMVLMFSIAGSAAAQTVTSSGTTGTVSNVPYISAASGSSTTFSSSPLAVSGDAVTLQVENSTSPSFVLQDFSGDTWTLTSTNSLLQFQNTTGTPLLTLCNSASNLSCAGSNSGSVGIGTTTPLGALDVELSANPYANSNENGVGLRVYDTITGTGMSTDYPQNHFQTSFTGSGTQSTLYGTENSVILGGSSPGSILSNAYAGFYRVYNNNTSTGTITNAYSLEVYSPTGSGAITNAYGLDIEPQGGSSNTNDTRVSNGYGIYQRGSNDINYFAGNVGIGTIPTSSSPPLSVAGEVTASSVAVSGNVTAGSFTGSGSGLTGIPYSALTGTPATGVSSFKSRTGAITPASGDYSVSQVTGAAPSQSPVFTGDVGIGASSPTYPLTLQGSAGSSTTTLMQQTTDGTRNLFTGIFAKAASADWGPVFMSDTSMHFVIDRENNVGGTDFKFFNKVNETQDLTTRTPLMVIQGDTGNVGIGTASPGAMLEVDGNIKLTANSGASITFADGTVQSTANPNSNGGDYAESVDLGGSRSDYDPGDLLVIDSNDPSKFLKSGEPYSPSVAGIFSTKPGTVGRRQTTPKSPDEIPMAVVGIVPAKVSAENGPIHPGDLLVSSSTPGYAMRGTDHDRMLGAVVGKAMGKLDDGRGVIEVLVTLQ